MLNEAYLTIPVYLDHREIPVGMCYIWEFSEKDTETVTGISKNDIKKIRQALRCKFGGKNGQGTFPHAIQGGYNVDGTLKQKDIFSDKQKRLILDIDPTIEFRFPIKELEQAPV